MSIKEANTICKNRNCTNGKDGKRKHFYSCYYCLRMQNWRSICCSKECFNAYSEQVIEARKKNNNINVVPLRTDMSENEVILLMQAPIKEVIEKTRTELSDYQGDLETIGFSGVVEKINHELKNRE